MRILILFRRKKENKVECITIIELHFNNFVSSIACETWRPGVQVKKHGINGCSLLQKAEEGTILFARL